MATVVIMLLSTVDAVIDIGIVDIFSEETLEIVSFSDLPSTSSSPQTVEKKLATSVRVKNLMEVKIYKNINFYRQIGTQTNSY